MNATTFLMQPSGAGRTPSDRRLITTGIAVVLAFFGVFGTWAALAPMNGAVIVSGRTSRST